MTKTFAEITGDFVGKPFNALGYGQEGADGYNCYGVCRTLLITMGKKFPTTGLYGKDITHNVNRLKALSTKERLKQENEDLINMAKTIGVEIPKHSALAGDFVIMQTNNGNTYSAIYAGNNQVLSSFYPSGVRIVPCDKDNKIIMARRLE